MKTNHCSLQVSFKIPRILIKLMSVVTLYIGLVYSTGTSSDNLSKAFEGGAANGDVRLRYESVDQEVNSKIASALTLRTRLNYKTPELLGFSSEVEFEDSRVVSGIEDYNDSLNNGEYVFSTPLATLHKSNGWADQFI